MLVPSEGGILPKDPTDRKVAATLTKGLRSFTSTSLTATCFVRATISWLEDPRNLEDRDHPGISSILKKTSQATVFMADASVDAIFSPGYSILLTYGSTPRK